MNRIEASRVDAARVGRRGFRLATPRVAPWLVGALAIAGCSAKADGTAVDGGGVTPVGDGGDTGMKEGLDASVDGGGGDAAELTDAAQDAGSNPVDGGVSRPVIAGCISALYDKYVLRTDGVLLREDGQEQQVTDATTGSAPVGIVDVYGGDSAGCVALSDGSAKCWQSDVAKGNVYGQLGNGTTAASSSVFRATAVLTAANTPLTGVVGVSHGTSNTACAVTADKKLYCWGDLTWFTNKGELLASGFARQITTDGTAPFTGVLSVAVGKEQACAIVQGTPNSVWCWGRNAGAELGQGDKVARQYPTQVLGVGNPSKIGMSVPYGSDDQPSVCVLDGGNVRCWGSNQNGSAGAPLNTRPSFSPRIINTKDGLPLANVTDFAPGFSVFMARRADETAWAWGWSTVDTPEALKLEIITPVEGVAWQGGSSNLDRPRYVTNDGKYHNGDSIVQLSCGAL